MAALLKKVPVLIELAKPKLNVFVKYAKVLLTHPMQLFSLIELKTYELKD